MCSRRVSVTNLARAPVIFGAGTPGDQLAGAPVQSAPFLPARRKATWECLEGACSRCAFVHTRPQGAHRLAAPLSFVAASSEGSIVYATPTTPPPVSHSHLRTPHHLRTWCNFKTARGTARNGSPLCVAFYSCPEMMFSSAGKRCFTIESLVAKESPLPAEDPIRPTALSYSNPTTDALMNGYQAAPARPLYQSPELVFPETVHHPSLTVSPHQLGGSHLQHPHFFGTQNRDPLNFYPWVLRNRFFGHRFQGTARRGDGEVKYSGLGMHNRPLSVIVLKFVRKVDLNENIYFR